jgi:integrase
LNERRQHPAGLAYGNAAREGRGLSRRVGKQHLRDGVLIFTQAKNAKRKPVRLEIPVVPELARIIEATPSSALTFLTSERGSAYTVDSFGNRFRAWCRAADLPQCSPHGLRKAAAGRLAELGASAHEIMAVRSMRCRAFSM